MFLSVLTSQLYLSVLYGLQWVRLVRADKMKRREDWYCLLYHVSVVGMYFLFFVAYSKCFPYYSLPEKVCFVLTGVVMLGWISALNVGVVFHNHVHRPIFRGRALNRWLARSWTVTCGWPSTLWEYAHLNVHHKHVLSAEDWTLPHTRNGKLESIYAFCFLGVDHNSGRWLIASF